MSYNQKRNDQSKGLSIDHNRKIKTEIDDDQSRRKGTLRESERERERSLWVRRGRRERLSRAGKTKDRKKKEDNTGGEKKVNYCSGMCWVGVPISLSNFIFLFLKLFWDLQIERETQKNGWINYDGEGRDWENNFLKLFWGVLCLERKEWKRFLGVWRKESGI